jgi:hypothetical protein
MNSNSLALFLLCWLLCYVVSRTKKTKLVAVVGNLSLSLCFWASADVRQSVLIADALCNVKCGKRPSENGHSENLTQVFHIEE